MPATRWLYRVKEPDGKVVAAGDVEADSPRQAAERALRATGYAERVGALVRITGHDYGKGAEVTRRWRVARDPTTDAFTLHRA